jgi:hypothetical protein
MAHNLVQLLNGAHRVNGRGQKTWQRFFVPMITERQIAGPGHDPEAWPTFKKAPDFYD